MKKIEFRTRDGYQYTITDMTEAEKNSAKVIFIDNKICFGALDCGSVICSECPLVTPTTETVCHGWSTVAESSIKITY